MVLDRHHASDDSDDELIESDAQFLPRGFSLGFSLHVEESIELEAQRDHGKAFRGRDAKLVRHLLRLALR